MKLQNELNKINKQMTELKKQYRATTNSIGVHGDTFEIANEIREQSRKLGLRAAQIRKQLGQ